MSSPVPAFSDIRLIAFYLPQFHPIAENDIWWGKGFTEWTNVTKAQPLFAGHYQPHLPADLGFYDLRLRETQHEQINLAKRYGVSAFCYHYYWFSGKRLLEKPVEAMLADPSLDMPFCLSWANENWTRRWDAAEHEILMAQDYSTHDDQRFVDDLIPYFSDPRYLRIGGAPFFIVYRAQQIPDLRRRLDIWRERCRVHGFEAHFCAALTHGNLDYVRLGFDSGVEFPPHNLGNLKIPQFNGNLRFKAPFHGAVIEFEKLASAYLSKTYQGDKVFKCVVPSWDNTARKKNNAVVVLNGCPPNFELWLRRAFEHTARTFPPGEQLVFVNAWNEWAEGCHLEPDRKYGLQYLEAVERVRGGRSVISGFIKPEWSATQAVDPEEFGQEFGKPKEKKSVSSKVRRELQRIARQVTQGRLRVNMEDDCPGLMVKDRPAESLSAVIRPSSAPDLTTFMDYEYEVDLTGNQAAAHVIRMVGTKKKVLEIGAGSGAITKHLVRTNGCAVTALEINPRSREKLRSYTQDLYGLDLNDPAWASQLAGSGPFDCVVAADVLEHLYDPWAVLEGMTSILAPDGHVILSLPHAGHSAILACLLQQDFEYREWGLLDKTHIRFFGIHNIEALYARAGLGIVEAQFVTKSPEETEFAERWRALPREMRATLSANKFGSVYQVVTKAKLRNETDRFITLSEMAVSL
jgi:2-polyprenyl-3-methyl-5-hydroxy-6-metoxy-1,4-benzoquinol methylase